MKTIEIVVATLNKDDPAPFTRENLFEISTSSVDKPVTLNFDQYRIVGKVKYCWVNDDGEVVVTIDFDTDVTGLYIVPGFTSDIKEIPHDKYGYSNIKITCFSAVTVPQDSTLKPVNFQKFCASDGVPLKKLIEPANCKLCGRELNNPDDIYSEDCGGDCLHCMAHIAQDPGCIMRLAKLLQEKSLAELLEGNTLTEQMEQEKLKLTVPPLAQSRWVRSDHDIFRGEFNAYTVLFITNAGHPHPRHQAQVVYQGDNGNLWSLPVSEWPGNLVKLEEM